MRERAVDNWDRSHALGAWSRALIAQRCRLRRPIFRGGSDAAGQDGRALRSCDLSGITLIVVDDNDDNVDVFATFLGACGASVLVARSAREALACLQHERSIDLMLTDLSMPGMNGIELVDEVRAHPRYAALPTIAVSGFPEQFFDGEPSRFSAFVLKPVELDELAAKVQTLVRARV
jgi:two-component system CheB/CheR fusion protein